MLKKMLITSAILATTVNVAIANPAPYVGIGTGVVVNTSNQGSHTIIEDGVAYNNFGGSFRGMPLNLFAGYGGVIDECFSIAVELSATLATAQFEDHSNFLKTTYGYGISILPGVVLSDHTLAYVRLGVVGTRFTDANKTRAGGQAGLGLQTALTQNVDLRGEYAFTAYKSLSKHVEGFDYFDNTPRTDAFSVSLVYKFD